MKTSLAFFVLAFNLVCHAQLERWKLEIPGPFDTLTNSGAYSDGVGGGAILIGPSGGTNYSRVIWFNSSGRELLEYDYGSWQVAVLRVRPSSLVLQTTSLLGPSGSPLVQVHRFEVKPGNAREVRALQLRGAGIDNASSESVVSVAAPQPDRRGFFTVQSSATNLLVRRYRF